MAYDEDADGDLVAIDAGHLFGKSITRIGIRKDTFLRSYMYEFIRLFAPHLSKEIVSRAMELKDQSLIDELVKDIRLPHF